MSKYVLSPSGKIIKQGEESDPTSITREMISTQEMDQVKEISFI